MQSLSFWDSHGTDFSMKLRRSGVFVAVPIPEKYEAEGAEIQKSVEQAVRDSVVNGVSMEGNRVTPWLLDRVAQLTGGKSISSSKDTNSTSRRIGLILLTDVALLETAAATGKQLYPVMPQCQTIYLTSCLRGKNCYSVSTPSEGRWKHTRADQARRPSCWSNPECETQMINVLNANCGIQTPFGSLL